VRGRERGYGGRKGQRIPWTVGGWRRTWGNNKSDEGEGRRREEGRGRKSRGGERREGEEGGDTFDSRWVEENLGEEGGLPMTQCLFWSLNLSSMK
jgi:hypothetical protein